MKFVKTWIQLDTKNKYKKYTPVNVVVVRWFVDPFGKDIIQTDIFDTFTNINQVWENKQKLDDQAANCFKFENYVGWKL